MKLFSVLIFLLSTHSWAIEYKIEKMDEKITDAQVEQIVDQLKSAERIFSRIKSPESLQLKIYLESSSMSHTNHLHVLEIPYHYKADDDEPSLGWELTRAGVVHELGHAIFDETTLKTFEDFDYYLIQKLFAETKKRESVARTKEIHGIDAEIWDGEDSEDRLARSLYHTWKTEVEQSSKSFFEVPEVRAISELFCDLVSVLVFDDLSIIAKLTGGNRSYERDFAFDHPFTTDPFYRAYTFYNPTRTYLGKALANQIGAMSTEKKSLFLEALAKAINEELHQLRTQRFSKGVQYRKDDKGNVNGYEQSLGLDQTTVNRRLIEKLKKNGISL